MLPLLKQSSRSELSISRATKLAAFETVEHAFRGKETEALFVAGDDAGGPVTDFNDIGIGHDCSLAGKPAFLSALRCPVFQGEDIRNRRAWLQRRGENTCGCACFPNRLASQSHRLSLRAMFVVHYLD